MKLFNQYIWTIALAGLSLTSCNDLDTEPIGATVTEKQKQDALAGKPSLAAAGANSIFSINSEVLQTTTNHYDIGYPTLMLSLDHRGTDLVSFDIGYNWYRTQLFLEDNVTGSLFVRTFWRLMYKQILAANDVIKTIDKGTADMTLKYYRAQGLAARAFDYFNLAQMYQQTYVGHEELPCVPLITDANSSTAATQGASRAKVKEVYAQILSDLDEAIGLLTNNTVARVDKRYFDLSVVYGLRARVNLVMNNWAAAATDAQAAINASSATPANIADVSKPTFIEDSEPNWMWGVKIEETDGASKGVVSFPSHMGSFSYGYASVGAWRMINKSLYHSIPATDVRKGWFLDGNKESKNLTKAQAAYAQKYDFAPYTQVKFAPYQDKLSQSLNANDIPLMRIEEMYLILAEAQAMGGDVTTGLNTLVNFVKTYRNPAYKATATTGEEVQDLVWFQRRIELWGEGLSYFDLLRLKKGIDRRGGGFPSNAVFNLPAESAIMIYPIPRDEIESNPMISDKDQNPLAPSAKPVADN